MPRLTLATYNLHWGLTYPELEPYDVVADCSALDVDVLVVQEAWRPDGGRSLADQIGHALGYSVTEVSLGRGVVSGRPHLARGTHGTGDWCMAVLSRVPVRGRRVDRLRRLRFDRAHRAVMTVDVAVDGWEVTVAATHLPHLEHGSPLLARSLRAALPPPTRPAILAGDMNMWGWCIDLLVPGWTRGVRGRTWPARRPHSQIDHVLVNPLVRAVDGGPVPFRNSDHRPLRVELMPA